MASGSGSIQSLEGIEISCVPYERHDQKPVSRHAYGVGKVLSFGPKSVFEVVPQGGSTAILQLEVHTYLERCR